MKYFTHPEGKFIIRIPIEWQYKNVVIGDEEKSPFSFQLYDEDSGCFQISCYSESEKVINNTIKRQKYNSDNLEFIKTRMDGGGFNMHLWYAVVEDHFFMAKYIYDTEKAKSKKVKEELKKAEESLKSLRLLSPNSRKDAVEIDKYEKFLASLAASFDLLNAAYKNKSAIEVVIILANQIDGYLRLAIVMTKQLKEKTNEIDISLLHQGENDKPISERNIYQLAKNLKIIDAVIFDQLESLYKVRNKMVHRYIISDFKTRNIDNLSVDYVMICEEIRLILQKIENEQFEKQIGIYGGNRNPRDEHSPESINFLYSQVNDKHLISKLERKITTLKGDSD
ncbi:hypothetical protein [Flavobacterium lindanitolerans]|jgi:hypothetical protein|uniref:hypothetical protein n=1 Tax=Flavobacterium lindanitolerans TaxID=428988 RepID=UPI0023F2E0AA|nr:hypothetical protein [Flavobacterium lindanitolerans]